MRKEIPLIICFLSGLLTIVAYFSGEPSVTELQTTFINWTMIIGGVAFLLATSSLLQVNLENISRKASGWGFSVLLLAAFFITLFLGCWYGVDDTYPVTVSLQNQDLRANFMKGVDSWKADRKSEALAQLGPILSVSDEDEVGRIVTLVAKEGLPATQQLEVKRYNPFFFTFEYIYAPMQATMFSLLAFFVASAAYRAFRARTKEATMLLVAAFLVMIGRVSVGEYLWSGFGDIAGWIMQVPQTAGQRAIQIGAALGLVSSSLRILLGLEQSYLGQD